MIAEYQKHIEPKANRHSLLELLKESDRVGFAVVDTSQLTAGAEKTQH